MFKITKKKDDNWQREELTPVPDSNDLERWLDHDPGGQLGVDVYQTGQNLVIKSAIAGVEPDDLDIDVQRDMVTIKGRRTSAHQVTDEDYYYKECHWGSFSRSIILPVEIDPQKAQADLTNGVLTITLPKAAKPSALKIKLRSEYDGEKNLG